MEDIVDLLQIKIEKAKSGLSEDTLNAINAVDWRAVILGLREKGGYSFEQLGDLELETELVLCGLLPPVDYPKELENRMKLSKMQVNELVQEMNNLVFSKIKEELIKSTERKKIFAKSEKNDKAILNSAGIEIITKPDLTLPELKVGDKQEKTEIHPMLAQKLSDSVQTPLVKTEHTLENITKTNMPNSENTKAKIPNVDPYREIPE
jgi:hypothetical protein